MWSAIFRSGVEDKSEGARVNHCSVRNVCVNAGKKVILDNVSVTISPGEWVSIVGPNGAGKSTLLSVMAGLRSSSGSVHLGETDLADMTPRERAHHLAYLPQHPELPPGMSVSGYVLIGRNPHIPFLGSEGQRDIEILNQVLEQLSLEDFRNRTLDSLSGGELQRCHLARILVQDTPMIFLDEPTTALDLGHQQQTLDLICRIRSQRELTVVMTMHDLSLAGQYSDRIVLLSQGEVASEGTPKDVLNPDRLSALYGARIQVMEVDSDIVVIPTRSQEF